MNPYFNEPMNMTYTNTQQNHPLQQSSQSYYEYKKFVSIHSEDRDAIAYPISSQFEIDIPEDITNVSTVRLIDWTFPSNYSIFAIQNRNTTLGFTIDVAYNPGEHYVADPLQSAIFEALFYNRLNPFILTIEYGFYNPQQMIIEMTNKMNAVVTKMISSYFIEKGYTTILQDFVDQGGYSRFKVVYNAISFRIWFGNSADVFTMLSQASVVATASVDRNSCFRKQLPDFSNYGLPSNLGLDRCNSTSKSTLLRDEIRFYYGDVASFGDNGYWLEPDPNCSGATISYIECPYKINLFGPSHIYLSIDGLNCIDVTAPFNISEFTLKTNETNGVVNQAFAKISLNSTPLSQFFDRSAPYYKFFVPPKDRIRHLAISLRYHNGEFVDFGTFPFTFTLEFTQLIPMNARRINIINV
jgi:hypothetical protein